MSQHCADPLVKTGISSLKANPCPCADGHLAALAAPLLAGVPVRKLKRCIQTYNGTNRRVCGEE